MLAVLYGSLLFVYLSIAQTTVACGLCLWISWGLNYDCENGNSMKPLEFVHWVLMIWFRGSLGIELLELVALHYGFLGCWTKRTIGTSLGCT